MDEAIFFEVSRNFENIGETYKRELWIWESQKRWVNVDEW